MNDEWKFKIKKKGKCNFKSWKLKIVCFFNFSIFNIEKLKNHKWKLEIRNKKLEKFVNRLLNLKIGNPLLKKSKL